MQSKQLKEKILQLLTLKNKESDIIQKIYIESGDVQLTIYNDDSIFCENPRGMELLVKIFKKRLLTSNEKIRGKYSIKKYFMYKGVEIFCLYKDPKNKKIKLQKFIGNIVTKIKSIITFIWGIITFIK